MPYRSNGSTPLSITKEKAKAKSSAIVCAISLAVVFLIPIGVIKGIAFLVCAVTGWQLLFHGSTAISMSLGGTARLVFQIAVAVMLPLLLSLYFIKDARAFTLEDAFNRMFSLRFLIGSGIVGLFSWGLADLLDPEHRFRGF